MRRVLFPMFLLAAACSQDNAPVKAITGAKLIDAAAGTVANAVVIIRAGRIARVGPEGQVPIPPGAERFDAAGKFLVAAPVEIPSYGIPEISTRDEARRNMAAGRRVLFGMFLDADPLEGKFIEKLASEAVILIPRLHRLRKQPEQLARASRNAKILADAGVMIAIGLDSNAAGEIALLTQAGLTPQQILAGATRSAAYAARRSGQAGSVQPDFIADLWLLEEIPLSNPAALARPARIMKEGDWVQ